MMALVVNGTWASIVVDPVCPDPHVLGQGWIRACSWKFPRRYLDLQSAQKNGPRSQDRESIDGIRSIVLGISEVQECLKMNSKLVSSVEVLCHRIVPQVWLECHAL